jgi:hypothetical protein
VRDVQRMNLEEIFVANVMFHRRRAGMNIVTRNSSPRSLRLSLADRGGAFAACRLDPIRAWQGGIQRRRAHLAHDHHRDRRDARRFTAS